MTIIRKNSFIRKVKDISISGSLALAILGNSVMLQSCGSSNSSEDEDTDYEEVEAYTKGVKTYISETKKGEFKITDEVEVPADSTIAIVKYLDGTIGKINPNLAKKLIDNEVENSSSTLGQNNNLSNVLLYGGMGYFLAKTLSPNYSNYRPDLSTKETNSNDTTYRRRHSSGFFFFPMMSRFYSSQNSFQKSSGVHESIGNSRTLTTRPVGGKSGFFRSTGRGGFRG